MYQEQGVNLGWDDEEYKISYSKMREFVKSKHSFNKKDEEYTCGEICMEADTGSHSCCFETSKTSEFDSFGVGLNLYLRFIKLTSKYFFIFFLINIPLIFTALNNYVNIQGSSTQQQSVNTYLYATSIGSISASNSACGLFKP